MQYSVQVRDAQGNAAREVAGKAPTLEIRAGAAPVDCAAPDQGSLIALGTLPETWMQASEGGVISKAGLWEIMGQVEAGAGSMGGHFRIKQGDVCHMQGTFGEGKEMVPDADKIAFGQTVQVREFSVKRGNA